MSRRNIEAVYPLSPMQRGMLFHTLASPESHVYFEQMACTLRGDLNAPAFERAWQRAAERHPVLRTSFVWKRLDKMLQVVHKDVVLHVAQHDWRGISEAEQSVMLANFLREDRTRGFNLAQAPLLRLALMRVGDDSFHFVWSHHHAILDGWSLPLLMKEVMTAYEAFSQGREPELEPVRPYRDYIAWLQRQDMGEAERFWRKTLDGFTAPPAMNLARDAGPEDAYPEMSLQVSNEISSTLNSLARTSGLTLNTIVQGAWALLLSRYTGEDEVIFGATVSGRPTDLPFAEKVVGLFINTLPVRVKVDPAAPAMSLLRELMARQAEARQYEYCSLTDIHGWSRVPRDVPLFESIIVFENYPVDKALLEESPGGKLRVQDIRSFEKTNYPLTVVSGPGQRISLKIAYDDRRFDSGAIRRMLVHMESLLGGLSADPGRPVRDQAMLTETERRQLLEGWNKTHTSFPEVGCIQDLFQAQAERTPDAAAVTLSGSRIGQITYGELNLRANRLAHFLRETGIGNDSIVGICVDRSLEMVIGLLGVLKAGGAYLPLDPSYPPERLAYMIEDSGVRVILTREKLRGQCSVFSVQRSGFKSTYIPRAEGIEGRGTKDEGRKQRSEVGGRRSRDRQLPPTTHLPPTSNLKPPTILSLDTDWPLIAQEPDANPNVEVAPSNLAYVIYTSGSTGTPKGVAVPHRALLNHALALKKVFDLSAGDRLLQYISLSFDASAEEIYPTLLSGATLVLSPSEAWVGGRDFLKLCEAEEISVLHLPVSSWHQWVEEAANDNLRATFPLRLLLVGGETPSVGKLKSWSGLLREPVRFLNAYGPTETTITTTFFETSCSPSAPPDRSKIPIGKPISNACTFILDEDLRPLPIGVTGELFIGGMGLALGYLDRPDLTGEKFIPDPFLVPRASSLVPPEGGRLYRTGDLARYLPGGEIEFLGRIDQQVKIRGFRIEPGEIEEVLGRHDAVGHAVVTALQDEAGNNRLVAYVVSKGEVLPTPAVLAEYLKERLPSYMLPSAFVLMESLPLTPSGKVDRKGLPAPEGVSGWERGCVAPRTPVEQMLCEVWGQVLGVERVGIEDNFYALGGHSLKATQLISRMQRVLEVDLKIKDLFDTLTVAALAERVESRMKAGAGVRVPPMERVSGEGDLPLSFSQQRLWFLDQLAPGGLFYNIPMAVRLNGKVDIPALLGAMNQVVRRHASLRTCFPQVKGTPVQVILPELMIALPIEDLSMYPQPDREVRAGELITEEARRPFDLERGPLLRGRLLKLGGEDHVMVLVVHHIVSDGWSMGVMIRELAALYEAYCANRPSPLPELKLQYADFASWQRQWLQGEVLEGQLAYWKDRLKGVPPMLELPTDRPRRAIRNPRGATYHFRMDATLSDALRKMSRDRGATLFMTLLAVFEVLLYRYTGQEDFCVGMPIANRNRQEIEGLIGFFVNTLAMRMDLSGKPAFDQLLERVRRSTLDAYTHQDLPFELLVEAIQPRRDLSHTPLFQVMFTMDPPFSTEALPSGLTLTPMEISRGSAVFDLILCVRDNPEGLSGYFEYNADLFDETTIGRMAGHYRRLLEGVASRPEKSIDRVDVLSEAEKRETLLEWNAAYLETPADRCVHELFRDRAEERSDSLALIFEDQALTYGELNRRANRLAHYLMKLGVGPEVLVGICTERCPEMIVGILGVLKAGGAYLPLDPAYPQERLRFMVEDSGVGVILTQEKLRGQCSVFSVQGEVGGQRSEIGGPRSEVGSQRSEIRVQRSEVGGGESEIRDQNSGFRPWILDPGPWTLVFLDTDWPLIAQGLDDDPPVTATPRNLAYVIYTSGSTGRPKGAMLSHAGLSNLTAAQRQAFGIDGESRVLQFSPLSFDASVWETFMALANGAALCLGRQEVLASGLELARLMEEKRVTNATLPPSVVRVLPREDLPGLRTVIAAGEACTAELVERWGPGRDFYNAYGPTETTVCASMKRCCGEDGPPPIGRPIANTRLYVLDGNLEPVPVGVPGELCVGGVSVARGYLGRPELTAEKFIPDPFGISGQRSEVRDQKNANYDPQLATRNPQPGGARLYRTGDLVKYLPNGDIQFLGRIDQQVKVRGFRIELGEVDEALDRVKGVKEGVVMARDDRLVAYVVPEGTEDPPGDEIRRAMGEMLPEYMVPSLFVYLDHLPMTPSGKVDRKGLPLMETPRPASSREYVPPGNPDQEMLVAVFQELLGIERVGIHDHFFELGGHSLLATRLISRIREEFGAELPLRTVFEQPTVAGLVQAITAAGRDVSLQRDKISDLLSKIQGLSDLEVKAMLSEKQVK